MLQYLRYDMTRCGKTIFPYVPQEVRFALCTKQGSFFFLKCRKGYHCTGAEPAVLKDSVLMQRFAFHHHLGQPRLYLAALCTVQLAIQISG